MIPWPHAIFATMDPYGELEKQDVLFTELGHFITGHFITGHFITDTLPRGHFITRTLYHTDTSLCGHFITRPLYN